MVQNGMIQRKKAKTKKKSCKIVLIPMPCSLVAMQHDFTTHSGSMVELVENTRKYCMKETKEIRENKRHNENQAIQELV